MKLAIEIRKQSIVELKKLVADQEMKLARAKLDIILEKSKNTSELSKLRREIAQALTIIAEKELLTD